jgi:TolB protein
MTDKTVGTTRCLVSFSSRGRIGLIDADGTGEWYMDFDVPGQAGWQFGAQFSDHRRILVHSFEDNRTWLGTVQSHVWVYDWQTQDLSEIATRDRLAPFLVCPVVLPGDQRLVANPVIDGEQRVFTMDLDGSHPVEITRKGDGFAYGISLSPDADRLAFHITPYRIWTVGLDGSDRRVVAEHEDHLYFGPVWSPDGQWLAYQDCQHKTDPGHDWADLCIGRPDGSEHRPVTAGQRHWFGTSYGSPETRGGGSNMTQWSPDGRYLAYTRALPGSQTAWQFQAQRPDTDHFNRDYRPEEARGGTQICLLDPFTGQTTPLTHSDPPLWDFRSQWSPDGRHILFSRVATGGACELWVMEADGANPRFLTRGCEEMGADFGRWMVTNP